VQAIESKGGFITKAVSQIGISYHTYLKWIKEDPKFREEAEQTIQSCKERFDDAAESVLLNAILYDKDLRATIFYLKTKAKHRGYVERLEQDNQHSYKEIEMDSDKLKEIAKAYIEDKTNNES